HLPQVAGALAQDLLVASAHPPGQLPHGVEEALILEQCPDLGRIRGQEPIRSGQSGDALDEAAHQLFRRARTSSKPSRMQLAKSSRSVTASGSTFKPTQQVPS